MDAQQKLIKMKDFFNRLLATLAPWHSRINISYDGHRLIGLVDSTTRLHIDNQFKSTSSNLPRAIA